MIIVSCLRLSEKCFLWKYLKEKGKNKINSNILWLRLTGKTKGYLWKQSPGRVLQERSSNIFGKTYRKTRVQEPFLKKFQYVGPQLYIKRGSCTGFLSVKLFRTAFL